MPYYRYFSFLFILTILSVGYQFYNKKLKYMENKDLAFICFMLFWYLLEEGGPRVKQMGIVRTIPLRYFIWENFIKKILETSNCSSLFR